MPDPDRVDASSETGGVNPSPDTAAHEEADDFAFDKKREELETLKISNARLREDLAGLKNDNTARQLYANRIFCLIAIWLGAIFVIMLLQGILGKEGMPFDWTVGMYGPKGSGV